MTTKNATSERHICRAIRDRRLLQFEYDGKQRVVAPYCYGISTTDKESLRAVQIRGESGSGGFGYGKLWTVERMADVQIADETFVPDDPKYNPNDSAMKRIICRIERKSD